MLVRKSVRHIAALAIAIELALAGGVATATESARDSERMLERGRYIARIAGCNDCHTPNYAQSGGQVPEKDWLTGDRLGWRGPWGTTYPANLRLALARLSEADWLRNARSAEYRPPMPWFALRDMSDDDLRALYRFIRSLGTAGEAAPAYLPPGVEPQGLAIVFPMPPK
jgi:mono/diheme cytochrome c family protein